MYYKELITESQKVNIILSYTYNNIHFSPNKYVIARTCRKHTMTVFDLGTVKKFPIFHPFPISAMTKENLYLFFSFCQAFFSIHTKYSWEYWDTCVIYDHIFLSSMQCVCTSCCSKIHPKKMRFREIFQLLDSKAIFIVFWNNRIWCCTLFPILEHTVRIEFWAVVCIDWWLLELLGGQFHLVIFI